MGLGGGLGWPTPLRDSQLGAGCRSDGGTLRQSDASTRCRCGVMLSPQFRMGEGVTFSGRWREIFSAMWRWFNGWAPNAMYCSVPYLAFMLPSGESRTSFRR
jgi:hypothetical protein